MSMCLLLHVPPVISKTALKVPFFPLLFRDLCFLSRFILNNYSNITAFDLYFHSFLHVCTLFFLFLLYSSVFPYTDINQYMEL